MNERRIVIAVPAARLMRWHERLRDALAVRWPDADVSLRFMTREDETPGSVTGLLALERLLLRRGKPTLCDRLDAQKTSQPPDSDAADIVVDLSGDVPASDGVRVLRPLYDGHETEQAAIAAILSGVAPTIALRDIGSGAVVAQGLPSMEAADGLTGGLEAVYSRLVVLIEHALAHPERIVEGPAAKVGSGQRGPLAFLLRNLAFQSVRAIYHLCCYSPHWRVGWRFVDGPDVFDRLGLSGDAPWRVMRNRNLAFAADPFPVEWRGRKGVFYEYLDFRTNIGEIHFQPFDEQGPTGEPVPAIVEPWHLSYPFLIEHGGELYMLPEASASRAVTLYRCVEFPGRWEPVARLLDGVEASDATIFRHGGRFWMTSVVRDGVGGYSDTLALHHAPDLFGPWEPHALSPVFIDSRFARPAGAVVSRNGALFRPAQDCTYGYGKGLSIMRIDRLDPEHFQQTLVARIAPGEGWPGQRLHTLNRWGNIECIDGAILTPKHLPLRRLMHDYIDRRHLVGGATAGADRAMTLALSED